jgi:serine phosphatase RsbU (regulator of sigma subunit)
MEIRGGNRAIDRCFEAPGLVIYVHSSPYQGSETGGGDIYYLTSCASGRISRLLLADVSGHGETASKVALSLRDLLRKNVNTISQEQFVVEMNREFGDLAREQNFATAVVATFFEPTHSLSFSLAGHPHPIYFRAKSGQWANVDPQAAQGEGFDNLPLGIHENTSYPGRKITVQPGDLFLLYSDALIESVDRKGEPLGIAGIVELLNQMPAPEPAAVIPYLRESLVTMSADNLSNDDTTMILCQVTSTRVSLWDNLLSPFRLLSQINDRTSVT